MLRGMKDDLPTPTARRSAWRVLGWGMLVAVVVACGWSGWRAYDYRAAVREVRAAGFDFRESPTPWAAIRANWRAALRPATWTERYQSLILPAGTDLAPLRPLLLRLDPTDLTAPHCRHLDALPGLTRLLYLDLTGADVKDLAPLAGLARLQLLDLTGCTDVKDLTPLASLAHLQALHLNGCTGVADLAPLAGLGQLQRLELNGCTGLGAEAVAAFKKSHPQVTVLGPEGEEVKAQ